MNLTPIKEIFGQDDQSWLGSAHGTNSARSITLDVTKFNSTLHYPKGYLVSGLPLAKLTATGLYAPYDVSSSEVQLITVTGGPTGGTFTLTFSGQTTTALAFNASAAAVQAALQTLSTVGASNLVVAGAAGGPYTVSFQGSLGNIDDPAITATSSLTGGTTPGVTITTPTPGGVDTAANGQQVLVGFLFVPAPVIGRTGFLAATVEGALLDHCRVIESKLPINVDPAGKADVAGRIIFV